MAAPGVLCGRIPYPGEPRPMPSRRLDPHSILATAERLQARVYDRFSERGPARVAREAVDLSRQAEVEERRPDRRSGPCGRWSG